MLKGYDEEILKHSPSYREKVDEEEPDTLEEISRTLLELSKNQLEILKAIDKMLDVIIRLDEKLL